MKVINLIGDEQVLRIKSALISLREALAVREYAETRMYRLAVARRFTISYFAFLNYLVSRVRIYEKSSDVGLEDILQRCRRYNLFSASDERMVIQMSMLYAALSYYNEGFDSARDELLADIPAMCIFLERFISLHDRVPTHRPRLEAAV